MRGLSLVAASGGHSSSRCAGLSLLRPLLLRSTGSRRTGSVIVAHRPSCSTACGIFPDQGSNPCSLHWQADSQPLPHQGSPKLTFNNYKVCDFLNACPGCYFRSKYIYWACWKLLMENYWAKPLALYYEDLLSKMKNKNKGKLGSSSESSCRLMQSISAVGQLSEKMIITMRVWNEGL